MKCHTTLLKNSRKTLVKGEQNDDDPFSQTSFLDFSNMYVNVLNFSVILGAKIQKLL